jgi:hypothetical protein
MAISDDVVENTLRQLFSAKAGVVFPDGRKADLVYFDFSRHPGNIHGRIECRFALLGDLAREEGVAYIEDRHLAIARSAIDLAELIEITVFAEMVKIVERVSSAPAELAWKTKTVKHELEVTPEVIRGAFVYLVGCCVDGTQLVVYAGAQYLWLLRALQAAPYYEDAGQTFWSAYDEGAADALRGLLVGLDLLEYGTSPRGAWLSERGAAVLAVLEALPDDFDLMPDSHEDQWSWHQLEECENCVALEAFNAFAKELFQIHVRKK